MEVEGRRLGVVWVTLKGWFCKENDGVEEEEEEEEELRTVPVTFKCLEFPPLIPAPSLLIFVCISVIAAEMG